MGTRTTNPGTFPLESLLTRRTVCRTAGDPLPEAQATLLPHQRVSRAHQADRRKNWGGLILSANDSIDKGLRLVNSISK